MSQAKKIVICLNEQELNFAVALESYNDLINQLQPSNKVAPMHNFLVRCSADDETKAQVKDAYAQGLTTDLAGALLEAYKPKVEIQVKK